MLTPTEPDKRALAYLNEAFETGANFNRRRRNPSCRSLLDLLDGHNPSCGCENDGTWSPSTEAAHVMVHRRRVVITYFSQKKIKVEARLRPATRYSHP